MRKVFNVFDSDHDGSITIQDVEKVMDSLQHLKNEIEMPSVDQIRIAFDKFDANSQFCLLFKTFNNQINQKLCLFLKKTAPLSLTNS